MKILILGGTAEARELAERLVALGHNVTSSLAGRTQQPRLPAGDLRVGKFGGVPGLVGYLKMAGIDRLVDATHPYAGLISVNAVGAAQAAGIPLVRFMRPAWPEPDGANWVHVPTIRAAASALPAGSVGFITTGHDDLDAFVERDDCRLMVRLIERPGIPLGGIGLIEERAPFSLEHERALFAKHGFTHLVSKNSGGDATAAKLIVAQENGATVIMVQRPVYGPAHEVGTIEDALKAIG